MSKRKPKRRDMEIAGPAGRDTLRAGAHLPPLQYRVLAAVVGHTAMWGKLEDHVSQGQLAEIVYDVDLSEVKPWQRKRIADALRALRDDHKLIDYEPPIGKGVKQLSRVGIPPSSRGDSMHSNPPSSSGGNTSSESPLAASSNPPSLSNRIPPSGALKSSHTDSSTENKTPRRARARARGGGVSENSNSKSKGGTDESPETRVRRHLSESGYGTQTINRVIELLHEDVRHPEPWADSIVEKVAGEVDAMNARAVEVFHAEPVIPPELRVPAPPEGHGGWRKVFEAKEPKQPKPKDQPQ